MSTEREARCGAAQALPQLPVHLRIWEWVTLVMGLAGTILGLVITIWAEIAGVAISSLSFGLVGLALSVMILAAAATVIVVIIYYRDRCVDTPEGMVEEFSGAILSITTSFGSLFSWNGFLDFVFPFSAEHDRVDQVCLSSQWDKVEDGEAYVFCTRLDESDRELRSEIMRCYFHSKDVCAGGQAAVFGAILGAIIGVALGLAAFVIGAAIIASIGFCATGVLCWVALIILCVVIVVLVVLIVAAVVAHIVMAQTEDEGPSGVNMEDEDVVLAVGNIITVEGNMFVRGGDDRGANVLWRLESAEMHGNMPNDARRPFVHCDIEPLFED